MNRNLIINQDKPTIKINMNENAKEKNKNSQTKKQQFLPKRQIDRMPDRIPIDDTISITKSDSVKSDPSFNKKPNNIPDFLSDKKINDSDSEAGFALLANRDKLLEKKIEKEDEYESPIKSDGGNSNKNYKEHETLFKMPQESDAYKMSPKSNPNYTNFFNSPSMNTKNSPHLSLDSERKHKYEESNNSQSLRISSTRSTRSPRSPRSSRSRRSRTSADSITEEEEKGFLLELLEQMEMSGQKLRREYTMDSSLRDIRREYNRLKSKRDLKESIKNQRGYLTLFASSLELFNQSFMPFGNNVDLEGWSDHVVDDIERYDPVFESLHAKYKTRLNFSPEMRLMMMISGSAVTYAATNRMAETKELKAISNSNPPILNKPKNTNNHTNIDPRPTPKIPVNNNNPVDGFGREFMPNIVRGNPNIGNVSNTSIQNSVDEQALQRIYEQMERNNNNNNSDISSSSESDHEVKRTVIKPKKRTVKKKKVTTSNKEIDI